MLSLITAVGGKSCSALSIVTSLLSNAKLMLVAVISTPLNNLTVIVDVIVVSTGISSLTLIVVAPATAVTVSTVYIKSIVADMPCIRTLAPLATWLEIFPATVIVELALLTAETTPKYSGACMYLIKSEINMG